MINSFAPVDPKLVDVVLPPSGYPPEKAKGDTVDALREACCGADRDFPQALWIEPKDWEAKARENDEKGTWALNYLDRFSDQSPSHTCTCHSLVAGMEACRNRQRGVIFPDGPKKDFRYAESAEYGSVWLSPLSVYSEANAREWGGAGIREVMEIAVRRGALPDQLQPREYNFKHTLIGTNGKGNSNQSGGKWVALKDFPSGWNETASWFKPLEIIFGEDTWEQAVSAVLNGYVWHVGRKGHAIPYTHANLAEKLMGYTDSYNVVRWDSWATVKGCATGGFAIATMTTPDDWLNPGGVS